MRLALTISRLACILLFPLTAAASDPKSSCDAKITFSGKSISVACIDHGCSKAGGACQVTNENLGPLTAGAVDVTPACSCISKSKGMCTLGWDNELGGVACGDNGCGSASGTCKIFYIVKGKKKTVACGCDISPGQEIIGTTQTKQF